MWCPQEVPLPAPPLAILFLIFFVLDYGMSTHFNVESKSLWRGIAGWSYIHTPLS